MNNFTKIFALAVLFSSFVLAQGGPGMGHGGREMRGPGMKKILELEKIKLIETLNMGEEVTLKFFARRTQHQNQMKDVEEKMAKVLDEIENEIKNENSADQQKLKKLNEDFISLRNETHRSVTDFHSSLKDILTTEQISKYIVFERNFREEMRKVLMRQRMNRTKKGEE